jgi:hypothetical protein
MKLSTMVIRRLKSFLATVIAVLIVALVALGAYYLLVVL